MPRKKSFILWDIVDDKVNTCFDDECWLWENGLSTDGYGIVWLPSTERMKGVHITAYELRYGPVPEGKELDHLCRNRPCWNPKHVEPVSHQVNTQRGDNYWRGRSECSRGHEYTEESIYWYGGIRLCRICNRERMREYRERKAVR